MASEDPGFCPSNFSPLYEGFSSALSSGALMPGSSSGFTVHDTHGPLLLLGVETHVSSARRGWTSLFASEQHEFPFEDRFDGWTNIVTHLIGLVTVHRRIRNGEGSRVIPPGRLFMVPGSMNGRAVTNA